MDIAVIIYRYCSKVLIQISIDRRSMTMDFPTWRNHTVRPCMR